jgi:hypothetical protein
MDKSKNLNNTKDFGASKTLGMSTFKKTQNSTLRSTGIERNKKQEKSLEEIVYAKEISTVEKDRLRAVFD